MVEAPEFIIIREDEENRTGLGVLRQCILVDAQIAPGPGYRRGVSTLDGSQTAFCSILTKNIIIVDGNCQKSQCPHNDILRGPINRVYHLLMDVSE